MGRNPRRASVAAGLLAVAAFFGQGGAPPATQAAGPAVAFTDPASGSTVAVADRFRLGWTESAPSGSPIVDRTLVRYSGPAFTAGSCVGTSFVRLETNAHTAPFELTVSDLEPATCSYWSITVTDVHGQTARATSGYVMSASNDAGVTVLFPVPGAVTRGPSAWSYSIAWRDPPTGATRRTVLEQTAPMRKAGDCSGVAWSLSRTLVATGPQVVVSGLASGTCYRYLVLVTDASGASTSTFTGALLPSPAPPACAYADAPTPYEGDGAWTWSLLDSAASVPKGYAPSDLVPTSGIRGMSGAFRIRQIALADLKALATAARAHGTPIDLTSGYRSYVEQQATYAFYVKALGEAGGLLRAARPGHSEHQLGTAIDVKAAGGKPASAYADWATTKTGAWMRDNAWRYGWVMSYPKGVSPRLTCYEYEPWHFRYVGRAVAKAMHDARLTLREYLWREGSLPPV